MNMDLKCEICEQRLSTNQIKKEHMNVVHGGVKKLECNVCSQNFARKPALIMHIENHHQGDQKKFKCNFCEKYFTNQEV